jgi:hypothetical protein
VTVPDCEARYRDGFTGADNGPGSLRHALAIAQDGDTIDATGVSGVITAATANHSMKLTSPLRRNSNVLAMPTCYTYLFLVRRHHAHPQAN